MSTSQVEPTTGAEISVSEPPIYIDLGERTRKAIRKLRKGEGVLANAVNEAIDDLKASGDLGNRAVVVVVRERPETVFDLLSR